MDFIVGPGSAKKKSNVRNLASSLITTLFSSISLYYFANSALFVMLMRK